MSNLANKNKSCAIIPFYNEKNTLPEAVVRTLEFVDFLILVDDGSDDGYQLPEVEDSRYKLLKHYGNRGKGAALKTGFAFAVEGGFEKVITLDADLQHLPEQIPEFINKLETCDLVIGSRKRNGSMPFQRILSNKITSSLVKLKTGIEVFDSQSGFRGYSGRLLQYYNNISDRWGAETEVLIISAGKKATFGFVEIPTIYSTVSTSKMQPVRAIIQFVKAIIKRY